MLFRINSIVRKHRMIKGVLRCEISEIIIESTCPAARKAKKRRIGITIVMAAICRIAKVFSASVK